MNSVKPYSQASENNKGYILTVLQKALEKSTSVLEVGSGSGQHAVHFAKYLPHVIWQTSDLPINHCGIKQWINEFPSANILPPINVDLNAPWPVQKTSAIYTANTLHIVSWQLVERFFDGVKAHLKPKGKLCIYGPFNYNGKFTSDSNANFELWLKDRDPNSGIRDFERILILAENAGLTLDYDHEMPANNRLLEFTKYS
jgi:cyclopropane fatty-acyl-phospholipid synthase-like methyltransferase